MRLSVLTALVALALLGARPAPAQLARLYPMAVLDEATLPGGPTREFPRAVWAETGRCLAREGLIPAGAAVEPPALLVVPWAVTLRVHDEVRDSLLRAGDPESMGSGFESPTVAYTLLRSWVVLVTEDASRDPRVLRHEAIHAWLWRAAGVYGHPPEAFGPCDWEARDPEAGPGARPKG